MRVKQTYEILCTVRNIPEGLREEEVLLVVKKFQKQNVALRKKRGEYIEKSLHLENSMDVFIRHFLFGTDYKKHKEFSDLVLSAEFCTFSQKKRMIKKILTNHPKLFPGLNSKKTKAIIQRIGKVISDRNKLAHGSIIFDFITNKPFLIYYDNGEKEIELNDDFFNKFNERYLFLEEEVGVLIADLRDRKPSN